MHNPILKNIIGEKPLSERELEVGNLLAAGLSDNEIASKLSITPAFHSSHSLICFCKFLISSAWASIILSFSDERFILNFFKSDFFADSKSASPKNKLYFILYKNYTNREPRTDYTGEGRIND